MCRLLALVAALALTVPVASAAGQRPLTVAVAGGITNPRVGLPDGTHLAASVETRSILRRLPVLRLRGEALLTSGERGEALVTSASAIFAPFAARVAPYAIAGAGIQLGEAFGPAWQAGVGARFRVGGRAMFAEARVIRADDTIFPISIGFVL